VALEGSSQTALSISRAPDGLLSWRPFARIPAISQGTATLVDGSTTLSMALGVEAQRTAQLLLTMSINGARPAE